MVYETSELSNLIGSLHASCSDPLEIGTVFGSFEVVGACIDNGNGGASCNGDQTENPGSDGFTNWDFTCSVQTNGPSYKPTMNPSKAVSLFCMPLII